MYSSQKTSKGKSSKAFTILNFINEEGETLEGKCLSIYKFAIQIENGKSLVGKVNKYLRDFILLGLYSKKIIFLLI
jgi:hypothetical protein